MTKEFPSDHYLRSFLILVAQARVPKYARRGGAGQLHGTVHIFQWAMWQTPGPEPSVALHDAKQHHLSCKHFARIAILGTGL